MQAIVNTKNITIAIEGEVDKKAVKNILNGARTDREFLADLLEWADASGLYAADASVVEGLDAPVLTDVPVSDEDGAIGVGIWAYQGAEAMGERLLRQGSVSLSRMQ